MTGRRYEIKFDPYARKALDSIDISIRRRILTKIESLAVDPWPHGATMLKGRPAICASASVTDGSSIPSMMPCCSYS